VGAPDPTSSEPAREAELLARIEDLERTLESLRIFQRVAQTGNWEYDFGTDELSWSEEVHHIFGTDSATFVPTYLRATEMVHPEDRTRFAAARRGAYFDRRPFEIDHRIVRADGEVRHVHQRAEIRFDESGRARLIAGTAQDVTDRVRTAAKLEESTARLSSVLESLTDGFFTLDRRGRFTFLNGACERVLGRKREDLLGRRIIDEFPDGPRREFEEHFLAAWNRREMVDFEAHYEPLGRWFEIRAHPTGDELAVTLRDVTDRRLEREALRQSVERFRNVARATSDAIWDWNIQSDTLWWGGGMEALFGFSPKQLEADSTSWKSRIHPDDRERVCSGVDRILESDRQEWTDEYRFARADGSWAWALDRGFVVRDEAGRALRMVGSMTDITSRREAEIELARLNRALQMRSACSAALIRETSEDDLLTEICRIAVDIGGYRMAWVGYAEDDANKTIRPVTWAGFEDGYLSEAPLSWSDATAPGRGPAGQTVRSGRPTVLEDAVHSPTFSWSEAARRRGYRGVVCLPLGARRGVFGLLVLYSKEVRPVADEEISLLQALADDVAFGITSLRSREEHERMQVAVSQMAAEVASTIDRDFFQELARHMTEALGAEVGLIARYLPGRPSRARTIAAIVDGEPIRDLVLPLDGTPAGLLADAPEAVVPRHVSTLFPGENLPAAWKAEAWIGCRLVGPGGNALGIVAVLLRRPLDDPSFALSTLRIFTARASAELERSRLGRLRAEQTAILERIATDAPAVEVARAAIGLLESEIPEAIAAVSLFDDEGRVLRLFEGPNLPADLRSRLQEVAVSPASGDWAAAAAAGEAVLVRDLAEDPRVEFLRDRAAGEGWKAVWTLPFLTAGRRVLGTCTLFLRSSGEPGSDEFDMIATTSRLVGLSVERERAQAALKASEARVRSTFAAAAAGIAITSLGDSRPFTLANRAFCDMIGYTEEELRGLDFRLLTHPDDRAESVELGGRLLRGEIDHFVQEKRYVHKNGHPVWARLSVSMVAPAEGGPASLIAVTQDITELKAAEATRQVLEEQLREAQKMEAIGTLAGGIAHDFNNILGAILGNVELARMDAGAAPGIVESLDEIWRAGCRAKELTKQILAFSRRDQPRFAPVSLAPALEESVRLLRATMPTRAAITLEVPADLPAVNADLVQIEQVLLNLGTNAVHAMRERQGGIAFRAEVVEPDEEILVRHPEMKRGPHVRVSVRDDGHGMDAATLAHIFEPFFTTKPVGEGTGLGLPVVHGILKAHAGAISVRSEPGYGSCFEVFLPVAPQAAATAPPPARDRALARDSNGKGHTILYIDDDASLLTLVKRFLGKQDYEVVAFTDAEEGLDLLRRESARFDLVLSDYNMPRLSGIDVARAVREIDPRLPVAITSGYITDELREEGVDAGVRAILFKPDFVDELCTAVRDLIAKVRGDATPPRA
jgi:PAS domain S-box-containing protein